MRNPWSRALLLVAIVSVAACQSTATPSSPPSSASSSGQPGPSGSVPSVPSRPPRMPDVFGTDYAPAAASDGGSIVIGDVREANQFHPYFVVEDTDARVASAAWSTLVAVTPEGRLVPDLATAIPTLGNGVEVPGISGDAMTVSWQLRPDLKWSDGTPLTCDDLKYTWEWVTDPGNVGVSTAGFENIKAFDCPSATAMTWHFDRIYAGYATLMTAPLPRHYLEPIPIADQTAGAGFKAVDVAKIPVSGPFAFESATPGGEIRMLRNPNHVGWASGGPAHLERLIWRWFADPAALIAGYRDGQVHVATGLRDVDGPKVGNLSKQLSAIPSLTYELLRPNWSATSCSTSGSVAARGPGCPMSDPALRQAVAFALDRQDIVDRVYGGTLDVADGAVPPGSWFHADQPAPTFDPDRARTILDGAGWVLGPDDVRVRDGLKARIELCIAADASREAALAIMAGRLKDVGIEAVPRIVTPGELFADDPSGSAPPCALARANFDLALVTSTRLVDPLMAFFRYHSSQVSPNGANDGAVNDPQIDAALRTVQTTADYGVMQDALAEFQRLYVEQTVEIPLFDRKLLELHSPKLGNFVGNALHGRSTWNVADWYLSR